MNGLRIAYVCADPGVPIFGTKGSTVHVQEVLRAMKALGASVDLFAIRWDAEAPPEFSSIRYHKLPPAPKGKTAEREQLCLSINDDIRAALQQHGPFDLVYERYSLWSFAAMEWARDSGIPGVLEVNAPLIEETATYRKLIDRPAAERVAQRVFGAASLLAPVSKGMAGHLREHASRVHITPNGVNVARFRPDAQSIIPRDPKTFTVGFVGNYKPWHGLPALVDAFDRLHRRHPNTRLLVVGEGVERERVEREIRERNLTESAMLTGRVDNAEIPAYLASMDVATAPYPESAEKEFYFSPLKLFEYLAAGAAIVASRIGQIAEVIEHERTGLLVQPGDAEALANALERLLLDSKLRQSLGENARADAIAKHTWTASVQRMLELALRRQEVGCT